jgi:hypothetical protein
MSVEVDICNSALIKLGAEPIADLSDNTKEARLCSSQFSKIRDSVLRSAPWNFAIKRVALAPTVDTPAFGDEAIFQLPADCVRFWKINDRDVAYTLEAGNKLLCNLDEVQGFYVSNTVPVANWDANFKEALACMLAADLCYSLTQSAALKQSLEASGEFWINQARSHSAQEQTPENYDFDGFLNARIGSNEIY